MPRDRNVMAEATQSSDVSAERVRARGDAMSVRDLHAVGGPVPSDERRAPAVVQTFPTAAVAASGWRHAVMALVLALAWILAAYRETAGSIVGIWYGSETFAHGFVVVPIALWLIWHRRKLLETLSPAPSWWMFAPLALAGFVWLLGALAVVNAVAHLALVAMLVVAVLTVLGIRVARAMAFPLGFLFFAVPIGEFLLPTLMEWTADFTVLALRGSGVPVYREGQQFTISSGNWSVVEACSGVRYLIASVMVGTVYAYLNYASLTRRLAFVGVSILVPIIANWVRAYGIVMLGHLSNNTIAVGVDHLIYGWLFFGVVMVLMFWIGSLWREDVPHAPVETAPLAPHNPLSSRAGPWLAAAAILAVTTLGPFAYRWIQDDQEGPAPMIEPLAETAGWRTVTSPPTGWKPRFVRPSSELHQRFDGGTQTAGLYVAFYRDQGRDRELVSSDNVLVPSSDASWNVAGVRSRTVSLGDQRVTVRVEELRGIRGERVVAWRWYWVDGTLTASDHRAKIETLWSRLFRGRDDSAAIVVYALESERGDAEITLESFVRDAWPLVEQRLQRARGTTDRAR